MADAQLSREIQRRRTFAIISHPDAGKTTLTEKFLLFGGAIQMAGTVKAKKNSRHAASDWMAMEKDRGISVSSSVMHFPYKDYVVNLLDTPGHQDFSEDTYRVLTAVDCALMVIDSAKGVEAQTKKLLEVCRLRNTPIITFINKLDQEGRPPLELLEDIEDTLQLECAPLSWPIGMGKAFRGSYNLYKQQLQLCASREGERVAESEQFTDLEDEALDQRLGDQAQQLREDVELLDGAATPFSQDAFLQGHQTPVFFGSAINNFGVAEILDALVELAPAPRPRPAQSRQVAPDEAQCSGFVFKIQANMDPAHRDRIAFLRLCSGRFYKGMKLRHSAIGRSQAIHNPIIFMAQDRSQVEEAYAGDIIGLHNHGTIKIGDSFTEKEPLEFTGIPSFAPEHFRRVQLADPLKVKQLDKGLHQLAEEGAVQLFRPLESPGHILGAVGVLQFDVIAERLKHEYGVSARYEPVELAAARWVAIADRALRERFIKEQQRYLAYDGGGALVLLAPSRWRLEHIQEQYPDVAFSEVWEHGLQPDG